MSDAVEQPWVRSRWSVPRADGAVLAAPDFLQAAEQAARNGKRLAGNVGNLQGRTFGVLRAQARREAWALALEYDRDVLGETPPEGGVDIEELAARPLVVPGHQPALYHPGVWAKNFASAGIAGPLGGHVLNLVVDNDIYARAAIDVPAGTREEPRREVVAFDERQRSRPWEGARVRDIGLFRSFGDRVGEAMGQWGIEPLVKTDWQRAVERAETGHPVPDCLTAFRHQVESRWGHRQWELPMSRLCESGPFLWVACHLLAHLGRFVEVYNAVRSEYRALYRIKSRNHPVPDLEQRDDWFEAPFWVWRDDQPYRRRVFARQAGREVILADDAGESFATLPLHESMEACCAVEVLRTLPAQGIRFRTRALTTTLFARLFLADLFVHGIGGAKYDEMTDRIMTRFYGVTAPQFATVSASLYLPFAEPFDVAARDEQRLVELIRDLSENPGRHAQPKGDPRFEELLARKNGLIAEQHQADSRTGLSRRERRSLRAENAIRFRKLRQTTDAMAAWTSEQRRSVEAELQGVRAMRQANALLTNREFSFSVYPEEKIRDFMRRISNEGPVSERPDA